MSEDVRGPYPAFIRDNPVMQAMFASFMGWCWRQEDMHAAHCADTGLARPSPPRNGLDAAIDRATGYQAKYADSFVSWVIDTQWGPEGWDDQGDRLTQPHEGE